MASPNISEIITTTIEARSRKVADNVTKNNAAYFRLAEKGNIKLIGGGTQINEELSYQENGNFTWFTGYDQLPVNAQDVLTSATYPWRSAACAVLINGTERRMNSGREALIDLLAQRMENAEATMINQMSAAIYSDGTGYGGKQLGGLLAAVPIDPTTGVYGGIDRAQWPFWRSKVQAAAGYTSATIQHNLNQLQFSLVRGADAPDLWLADVNVYTAYVESMQTQIRFTNTKLADAGFTNVKYMQSDFVLDGGIGGFCPVNSAWALNTKYIRIKAHKDMNMRPLDPDSRSPLNQDATAKIMGWMGNLTVSNSSLQGFFKGF